MRVLDDWSLEMTGKDVPGLEEARALIPEGTRVNVTFLGNENLEMRLAAATAVRDFGFVPVPHISARRLASQAVLEQFLSALQGEHVIERVFVVGGDPHVPEGPFASSAEVIATGVLPSFGVADVSIAGYPEGHPDINEGDLWDALETKAVSLGEQGLRGTIITQFGFDVDAVLAWVKEVRARGIDLPIRVGVPGPAGIKRLLAFAARFGVASSAGIARKYGMSLTNLLGTAGPDRFIRELESRYEPERHGILKLHFYTFGGLAATSEWIDRFKTGAVHGR